MKEEKSTNAEEQTQQIARKEKYKIISDKIKNYSVTKIFILFITVELGIVILPNVLVQSAMSMYSNSTTANMYISTVNNSFLVLVTCTNVILTGFAVQQSEAAVIQSRKEQKIRDIENRLEKFYIPADKIIGSSFQLIHLRKYSYLADKTTYEAYEKYTKTSCKNLKLKNCVDMYRDFDDYKCSHEYEGCRYNWQECDANFDRCEHFSECPNKDPFDMSILNNTLCKHYIEFKERITEDIEHYKKELLKLKE